MYNEKMYFAAANGFDGFRSNFERLFFPEEFKKLYVLKGGPGTGKSTLMKKVGAKFEGHTHVTYVFCSSDPRSLDGVILENDNVKIGIVDGTAPHVVEPKYPGAVEEIINLGDGFDYPALMSRAEQIITLSNGKSKAYKSGYSALKSAGEIYKQIDMILFDIGVYNKAETFAAKITSHEKTGGNTDFETRFLISSFSKDGYTSLPLSGEGKDVITVKGDGFYEYAVMMKIYEILKEKQALKSVYRSPLSEAIIDALESNTHIYTTVREIGNGVKNDAVLNKSAAYNDLKDKYNCLLAEAQESFRKASEYHFELEDIYSRNITFESNNTKLNRIISAIEELFNK